MSLNQIKETQGLQGNVDKTRHLIVTFFRKNVTHREASVPTTAKTPHTAAEGGQNDHTQDSQVLRPIIEDEEQVYTQDELNLAPHYNTPGTTALNGEQEVIWSDFNTALLSNGRFRDILAVISRGTIYVTVEYPPLAYNAEVFQARYMMPSPPGRNPPIPDLKAVRTHRAIIAFELKHSLEIVFDVFSHALITTSASPTSPTTITTAVPYRPIKLALFDMDSTLILEEVIDELARSIGAYDAVSTITSRAMADPTFDFAASLRARVALLRGVPASIWSSLQQEGKIHIAPGAQELIARLKARGCVTGVISGGFTPMAEWLKAQLGLDLAFANHLASSGPTAEFPFDHLTGQLDLTAGKVIVTPDFKRNTLIAEAAKRGIPMQMTLAAGDGSNDLKMLGAAGLGIAWNAKPRTQEQAPMRLNRGSLSELLFLLGPSEDGGSSSG